jgi:hypothetical protein
MIVVNVSYKVVLVLKDTVYVSSAILCHCYSLENSVMRPLTQRKHVLFLIDEG